MEADDITVLNVHKAMYIKPVAEVNRLCQEADAALEKGERPDLVMEKLASRLEMRGYFGAGLAVAIREGWRS
jgi:hypothetical protein